MRTSTHLAFVLALTALLGTAAVPYSHATDAGSAAPAAQAAPAYLLHIDGMT